MRRTLIYKGLSLVVAISAACSFAIAQDPTKSEAREVVLDIPAQPIGDALSQFAVQSGMQVVAYTDRVQGMQSPKLTGSYLPQVAINKLLAATPLRAEFLNSSTIIVRSPEDDLALLEKTANPASGSANKDAVNEEGVQQRSFWERFRVAEVDQGASTSSSPSSVEKKALLQDSDQNPKRLDEVIVTAQKREERLQEVPVPVTALDANTLTERGEDRLQDYFATVPGLNLNAATYSGGTQSLAIRGVTTGAATNPTVGVVIDEVPFGSSTFLGDGAQLAPDLDPSDLARIEVLRGPQGTFYGASSIGGLVKFVSADPSTKQVSGHVQVSGEDVQHGESGYGARGAINIPLSDTLAVRASAFGRRDPGYVDNVLTSERDVNRADVSGGRISGLWRPTEDLSVKVGVTLQNADGSGNPAVDTDQFLRPTLGDLKQARLRGSEAYSIRLRFYTANLTAKILAMDFVSISGYGTNTHDGTADVSLFLPSGGEGGHFETKKFSQEFRLSSASDRRLQWMAGAFYTHERSPVDGNIVTLDPVTGAPQTELADFSYSSTLSEYALFADLTAHFTERFDVQVGGRESWTRQSYEESDTFGGPPAVVTPTEHADTNAFTYLVTPRYRFSPDLMLYARFASGYRVGGPNVTAALQGVPLTYKPDKTNNYELGFKGDFLDHLVSLDVSAYYIDWKNIQIYLLSPTGLSSWITNAGRAKSQGLEFSAQTRPRRGLNISAAATLNDAQLTQDFPASSQAVGFSGDRLPFSSRFSASLAVDQDLPIAGPWSGFVGGSIVYVGTREGQFASSPTQSRLSLPSYVDLDLRVGARYNSWTITALFKNVANRRGIVGGNYTFAGSGYDAVYIQPRTVGLSIARSF